MLAFAGVGFFAIVAQTLYVRELLVVVLGNELVVGVVLGAWLVGIAAGSFVGGLLADRARNASAGFFLLAFALVPAPLVGVALVRTLRHWADVPVGQLLGTLKVLTGALVCETPTSLLVGLLFPFGARAAEQSARSRASISAIYVTEAAGSVAGGLVFTFLMVGRLGGFSCLFLSGAVLLGCLFAAGVMEEGIRGRKAAAAAALGAVFLVASGPVASFVEGATSRARWRSISEAPLIHEVDTPYQHVALTRMDEQTALFTDGYVSEIFPDEYGAATTAALVLAEHPRPERVLVLGSGAGGLVQKMAEYDVVRRVELVLTDKRLFETVRDMLPEELRGALSGEKVRVIFGDPRLFVKRSAPAAYDCIFINAGDPRSLLANRLRTREFLFDLARVVRPGGVVALPVSASDTFLDDDLKRYLALTLRTVRDVFPHAVVMPAVGSFIFASRAEGIVTAEAEVLERRAASFGAEAEKMRLIFRSCWLAPQVEFLRKQIESVGRGELNTDAHPRAFFSFLKIWDQLEGAKLRRFFQTVEKLNFAHVLIFAGALILLRGLYLLIRVPAPENVVRFNVLAAIATTGFAGFALEIVLLAAYQAVAGHLFERIALLVAAFMGGLALGATGLRAILARWRPGRRRAIGLMITWELAVAACALACPFASRLSAADIVALATVVGFLVGAEFPVGIYIYHLAGKSLARTAANLDSCDHFGAIAGATLTATLLIPAFGLFGAGATVALFNVGSALALFAGRGFCAGSAKVVK